MESTIRRDEVASAGCGIGRLGLALATICIFAVSACGGGGGGSSGSNTATVELSVVLPDIAEGLSALATPDQVQAVFILVSDVTGAPVVLVDAELTRNPVTGAFERTLSGLPIGTDLEFLAEGFDSSANASAPIRAGTLLFDATTVVNLTNTATDSVTLFLSPVDGGLGSPVFPKIVSIVVPDSIFPGTTVLATFGVEGDIAETLSWDIAGAPDEGLFTPASGTITFAAGEFSGQVQVSYDAPTTEGIFEHKFSLTNSGSVSLSARFLMFVSLASATGGLKVFFSPVVIALEAERTGENDIIFGASVADDDPVSQLTYNWGYGADASTRTLFLEDSGANPVRLLNYVPEDVSGTITLSVTDLDGGTSLVSIALPVNQFPDAVATLGPLKALAIAAGNQFNCAVLASGAMSCWGLNTNGQLGDGTTTGHFTQALVGGIADATVEVTAGQTHACVIVGGTVQCWGNRGSGRLGDGGAVSGNQTSPVEVSGIASAVDVAAGNSHTCAILSGGAVQCWGLNNNGQLGIGTLVTTSSNIPLAVPTIDGGSDATIAISIAAGALHTCAVMFDNTVKCWGSRGSGRLGDNGATSGSEPDPVVVLNDEAAPATLTGAVEVTVGSDHSCALMSDGTVECWGSNASGKSGDGTTSGTSPVAVAVVVIDGGLPENTATAVSAGNNHTCALMGDGTVTCWGSTSFGQLGIGLSSGNFGSPQTVLSIEPANPALGVTAGPFHACAILGGGNMRCWGDNINGLLGDGTSDEQTLPVGVDSL